MVPDLVAEMPEQGAVGLAHLAPALLALGIVGLDERDGDDAVVVAGHHLRALVLRRVGQEVEDQPVLGILGPGLERQVPAQQAVEQPVLGEFHLAPLGEMVRVRHVGDRAVVAAGEAEGVARARRHQPVAGVVHRVGAEPARPVAGGERRPVLGPRGLQRRERPGLRQVGEAVSAALAGPVLEIQDVAAGLALEQFHRSLHRARCPPHGATNVQGGGWLRPSLARQGVHQKKSSDATGRPESCAGQSCSRQISRSGARSQFAPGQRSHRSVRGEAAVAFSDQGLFRIKDLTQGPLRRKFSRNNYALLLESIHQC